MKKIIVLTVLIAVFSISSFSQNTSFGVNAGATIASGKYKDENSSEKSDGKAGFTAGVFAKVPLAESIDFLPTLNFTQKGGKLKDATSTYTSEETLTLNYVELLLNFLYNVPAGKGKFIAGLGPVASYGISGKYKYKVAGQPEQSEDVEFGNDENNDHYKPFEFGGNILTGYEFSCGVYVMLSYYLAFSNIALYSDADYKNRYFAIRIGYLLSGLMKK